MDSMKVKTLVLCLLLIGSFFTAFNLGTERVGAQTVLADDTPLSFPTPMSPEDFEFEVLGADHAVVGIRPPSGANYSMDVYTNDTFSALIEDSAGKPVNLVTLNKSTWVSPPNRGARVTQNLGSGDFQIEMENDLTDYSLPNTWSGDFADVGGVVEVLDAFQLLGLTVGSEYVIHLDVPPAADLDMYLFDFIGDDAQEIPATWQSAHGDLDMDELITFNATITGDYILVITNANGGTGSYTVTSSDVDCTGLILIGDDMPMTCPTPSPDTFEYYVMPTDDHAAIALRSPPGQDYDIETNDNHPICDVLIKGATGKPVDIVGLDMNVWQSLPYRCAITFANGGTGSYQIELESNFLDMVIPGSYTGSMDFRTGGLEVIDALGISNAVVGIQYRIDLTVPPTADLDMYLFDFVAAIAQNSDTPPWSSENDGMGVDESITFTASIVGEYMLVISNRNGGYGSYGVVVSPIPSCPGLTTLADDSPMTCPTPAPDEFEFVVPSGGNHTLTGIRVPTGNQYQLDVFEETSMTTLIENDLTVLGAEVGFVALDKTDWGSPISRGARITANVGTGDYQIEMENDYANYVLPNVWFGNMSAELKGIEVLDAFELSGATVGWNYFINLTVPSSLDLDMYLFDFVGDNATTPPAPNGWESTNAGTGTDESIQFTASITGDYLLVITNKNGGAGTYKVNVDEQIVYEYLDVTWTNLAPATVEQWQVNVEMLSLNLSSTASTNVTGINITLSGTGSDSDIKSVSIYDDANDNSVFEPGVDVLLGRGEMFGGVSSISFPNAMSVSSGTSENILVIYNIHPLATPGNTSGANVTIATDITTSDGDIVNLTIPAQSGTPTINTGAVPLITSQWQETAPTADGSFAAGEHIILPGINAFNLEDIAGNPFPAWLIVENNGTNLWITYDVVGDMTDDGAGDSSGIGFDTDNDDAPTNGADDQLQTDGVTMNHYEYDAIATNWVSVDPCTAPGVVCSKAFGPSPNNATAHQIFEYQVPLAELGVNPGDTLGFLGGRDGFPGIWDSSNTFDYVSWPHVVFTGTPLTEYGDLLLAAPDLTPPNITFTIPANNTNGVAVDQDIIITFSEPMNRSSLIAVLSPDPGNLVWNWNPGNTTATGTHNPFASSTNYTLNVTSATDVAGNPLGIGPVPNPWSWRTADIISPWITNTNPMNDSFDVSVDQDVVITFSEPMNRSSLIAVLSPDPGNLVWNWNPGNTTATGTHNPFASSTNYTLNVTSATDAAGNQPMELEDRGHNLALDHEYESYG
jgi:hypothetical protein